MTTKELQKVNSEIDAKMHADFKSKCAGEKKTMSEVLEVLIPLYLKGKVKWKSAKI